MSSSIRSSALLLGLTLLWAAPALSAQPAQPSKKALASAKAAFAAGKKHFDAGRYPQAIDSYAKAYELSSKPAILFNIGQCHKKLEHWERAVFFFQRYLDLSPKPVANEVLARTLLDESKARLLEGEKKPAPEGGGQLAAQPAPEKPAEPAAVVRADLPQSDKPAALVTDTPSQPKDRPEMVPLDVAAAQADELHEESRGGGVATRWWFWTTIAAVVVAGGVTAAVLATQPGEPKLSTTSLGEIHF